jgi:hypothetical protein
MASPAPGGIGRGGRFYDGQAPMSSVKRRPNAAASSGMRSARSNHSGAGARTEDDTDFEDAHSFQSLDSLTYQGDDNGFELGGGGGYGGGLGAMSGWDDDHNDNNEMHPHAAGKAFPWENEISGSVALAGRGDKALSVTFAATNEVAADFTSGGDEVENGALSLSRHSLGPSTMHSAGLEPSQSLAPPGDTSDGNNSHNHDDDDDDNNWARGVRHGLDTSSEVGGWNRGGVTLRRGGAAATPVMSERSLSQASASAWAEDHRRQDEEPLRFNDDHLEERNGLPVTPTIVAEGRAGDRSSPHSQTKDNGDHDSPAADAEPIMTMSGGVMEFNFASPDSSAAKRKADAFAVRSAARAAEARQKALQDAELARTASEAADAAAAESSTASVSSGGGGGGGGYSFTASPGRMNSSSSSISSRSTPGSARNGGVEKLAARLAAGSDESVPKVPPKEAKRRSARLYQALPEVAAARQKKDEAQARLDRIAMAKANGNNRARGRRS